ncbi:MAG: hypothetical protein HWD61_09730 [Parachlamydiaceae bacterium]|nr:MAG: hypothetical protein HWD61_09730 [Parachlamydiaceae bacterium]
MSDAIEKLIAKIKKGKPVSERQITRKVKNANINQKINFSETNWINAENQLYFTPHSKNI